MPRVESQQVQQAQQLYAGERKSPPRQLETVASSEPPVQTRLVSAPSIERLLPVPAAEVAGSSRTP